MDAVSSGSSGSMILPSRFRSFPLPKPSHHTLPKDCRRKTVPEFRHCAVPKPICPPQACRSRVGTAPQKKAISSTIPAGVILRLSFDRCERSHPPVRLSQRSSEGMRVGTARPWIILPGRRENEAKPTGPLGPVRVTVGVDAVHRTVQEPCFDRGAIQGTNRRTVPA